VPVSIGLEAYLILKLWIEQVASPGKTGVKALKSLWGKIKTGRAGSLPGVRSIVCVFQNCEGSQAVWKKEFNHGTS
jgi:hypothetical protein